MAADLKTLSNQIATELIFAETGKDNGLLPINSLLLQIEDAVSCDAIFEPLASGVQAARISLDRVFETAVFDEPSLARLGEWSVWFQGALTAAERGLPIETLPSERKSIPAPSPAPATLAAAPAPSADGETPLFLDLEQDTDLIREFINESGEHLQNIEEGVLALEENPADLNTLNSIFRAFHTFKGGAGFLNLTPIHDLAHALESLLDLARQQQLAIDRDIINIILAGGDRLKQFTDKISSRLAGEKNSNPIVLPTQALLSGIRSLLGRDKQHRQALPPENVSVTGAEISIAEIPVSPEKATTVSSVKVDTQKLDGLIDAVGEMVIAQSLVVQNPALKSIHNEQLNRNLAELARITKELQRTAMSLRMVPIHSTFQKMHRVVRDTAAKIGKKVELLTEGEETELDRNIVEQLSDPLIHMVRNSVDHGVETPRVRLARGKSEHGTVWLKAFHEGGNIVLEIKDDGNGLDRNAILAKAREKGLVGHDEQLSDNEIFSLVFAPGFSTATRVTELSGRGVGMDVVQRNIEKLQGKVEIQSQPGEGTTFRIFLPLTLAIIDGLLVGVGEHRYILPTLMVSESFRPAIGAITTVQGRGELVTVRGRLRPLVRLYEHFGIEPLSKNPEESIVVVLQSGCDARCVLVDKLLGKQEVVIKSLGESFQSNRYLAGAAILGDGRVGLILDAQALVHLETGSTLTEPSFAAESKGAAK